MKQFLKNTGEEKKKHELMRGRVVEQNDTSLTLTTYTENKNQCEQSREGHEEGRDALL